MIISIKHGLLGLLNYGSMTGYDLDKAFRASLYFFWQAKTSQIYRELDTMEQNGWLSSERVIQNDKPNKRVYSITDSGKKELVSWLSSPESDIAGAMHVKSAFLMRVFFAGEMNEEQALSMLRAYGDNCAAAIEALGSVPGAIADYGGAVADDKKTRYWNIAALYGEEYYRAGLSWVEKAITILEGEV